MTLPEENEAARLVATGVDPGFAAAMARVRGLRERWALPWWLCALLARPRPRDAAAATAVAAAAVYVLLRCLP